MPLMRCTSCAYANAMDAKVCKKCGAELRVPPHLMRCAHCGTLNPIKGTACVWCYRKLHGSWRRRLLARPAQGAIAATAVVLLAAIGYYAYPRGLPQEAAPAVAAPAAHAAPLAPAPAAEPQPAAEAKPKAVPPPIARQGSSARRASEREERSRENCAEGVAALGLCAGGEAPQAPRPKACTEAVAALGLCDAKNIQGRE